MANEPNNAEEQLKQYAGERRQQVPQEIHPATRNVLLGEVRRVYGSPEEERRATLRMRWLQAFAWIAILAAIPLFLLPRQPKDAAPAAAPSRPGEVTLPMEKKKGEAPIVLSDTKEPVAPIVVAPQPASLPQTAPTPVMKREDKQVRVAPAVARAEPESRARAMDAAAAVSNTKLLFANTISNQQVLNRFQLEQTGERLKITEANDGSVYSGRVFSQQAGADNFQAAGFNRTLNKGVILTGQVVRLQNSVAQQQQSALNNVQNNVSNEDVRVQGQAIIGNTQYKVDAQVAPAK
ncbi:MAG TPA: hypothetical protein VM680_01580 [Verrucomicrobiae bacterium]|nr:hypothetical protein [Verrucomicrobiae bacterium]